MSKVTLPRTPLFEALSKVPQEKTAIIHSVSGKKFSYGSLLADVAVMRGRIGGSEDLKGKRVAMLVENGYEYVGASSVVYTGVLKTAS
jgi:malonyl-CoA/methylmalonyl-CoA synthetase